jgi:hypothetical protein
MGSRTEFELVGDDCRIYTGKLAATELVGDGTKTIEELAGGTAGGTTSKGFYVITALAASSFFATGMKVGWGYPVLGTEVLKTGDKIKKLILTPQGDASGWKAAGSRSEIDVTKLCHEWKKYRFGKKDLQITLNTISTLGVSDEAEGTLGRSFTLFRRTAAGVVTISVPDDTPVYFIGYIRETSLPGETEAFMFAQVVFSTSGVGGGVGSAQSQDITARLSGQDPIFYSIDIPA